MTALTVADAIEAHDVVDTVAKERVAQTQIPRDLRMDLTR